MEILKEVANVAGHSGLYRILKPSRTGVIVESLDGKKTRTMIGASARVSVLKDVSIFTTGDEDSAPLSSVFLSIREQHGDRIELSPKGASGDELAEFMEGVLPDYDRDRVYDSDIRKVIQWYNILSENYPDSFEQPEAEEAEVHDSGGEEEDETEP